MRKKYYNSDRLSNQLWPIHVKPQEGELFSTWMIRMAHSNGLKVQTFTRIMFGHESAIWNRDIDKQADESVVKLLSNISGAPIHDVYNLTLKSYDGILSENININGMSRWIIPIGVYHRKRTKKGLMYCPKCLSEDSIPYYRREWRLAFNCICPKHNTLLIDCCPQCESPVIPHRSDMMSRGFYPIKDQSIYCWKCGFDYRKSKCKFSLDTNLIELHMMTRRVLRDGYINWGNSPSMYSIVFFDGLHELICGILSKNTLIRIRQYTSININANGKVFELLQLGSRYEVLSLVASFMHAWPNSFIDYAKECKFRYSDMQGNTNNRRYWYDKIIKEVCWQGGSAISDEEKKSIVSYIEHKKGHYTNKCARELSGRDLSKRTRDITSKKISYDVYEEVMCFIDHEIAGTFDKLKRLDLIRDKIMLACSRIFNLSIEAMSGLANEMIESLCDDNEELSFYLPADSKAQAKAWLVWYREKIRPMLRPSEGCRFVFTSAITKDGLKKSSISARLKVIFEKSGTDRYIKDYSYWVA